MKTPAKKGGKEGREGGRKGGKEGRERKGNHSGSSEFKRHKFQIQKNSNMNKINHCIRKWSINLTPEKLIESSGDWQRRGATHTA